MKTQPPLSLEGKTALITGGTTGIGRAIAIALAREGARTLIFGRHEKELKDALTDIRKENEDADGLTADVARDEDVAKVFAKADEMFGDLDILIDNAAIGGEGLADEDDWRYIVDTNISGYFACARQAADRMRKKKDGQIVLVGSISADTRDKGGSVYAATKAATQAFAQAFSQEMAEDKVRVSLVEPGTIGSDIRDETPEEQRKQIKQEKMLAAEDVADCVLFMLTRPPRVNLSAVTVTPLKQDW